MKTKSLLGVTLYVLFVHSAFAQPGTTNHLTKFITPVTMGNSIITDNGTDVGIGTEFPAWKLDVSGHINISRNLSYKIDGWNVLSAPGTGNTFAGINAGFSNTSGSNNTAHGYHSLWSNTTGIENTANGSYALYSTTTGIRNIAIGTGALYANITGSQNTANGWRALYSNTVGANNSANGFSALYSNTTGSVNTAIGANTLYSNANGSANTAIGSDALYSNTSGSYNMAAGAYALTSNTIGNYNTANGPEALYSNTTGAANTAVGANALYSNTTGGDNTAIGYRTLYRNTTGNGTATGNYAMFSNTTGIANIAYGYASLYSNTTGNYNSAIGNVALYKNTTGWLNTATGGNALWNNTTGHSNTANGHYALLTNVTGNNNTAIGYGADVGHGALSNATAIGNGAVVNASNKIRLGNAAVSVIEGPVLYTISDGRFKSGIEEEGVKGLEFINRLRPVAYNFNAEEFQQLLIKNMPDSAKSRYMDENKSFSRSAAIRHTGFVAQEMEQAMKESGYDFNGLHVPEGEDDNYSIAYGLLTVPLVKAVQEQQKMISDLQKQLEILKEQMSALTEPSGNTGTNEPKIVELSSANSIILDQNEPNPFAEQTSIRYMIPADVKEAQIIFYDVTGRIINTVEIMEKGTGVLLVYASDLSSGIYTYTIVADGKAIDTKKMMKAK